MTTAIWDVRGLRTRSRRWIVRLVRGSLERGLDPGLVAAVMSFETGGTFDPTTRNPHSAAVGLIQWTKKGAKSQGYDREQIARLSDFRQLDLALAWFAREHRGGRLVRPVDYYLAVFWPEAIGLPASATIIEFPSKAYEQNKGLDVNDDGKISVGEIRERFSAVLSDAATRPRLVVVDEVWPYLLAGVAISAAAGGAAWALARTTRKPNPGRSKAAEKKMQWGLLRTAVIASKDRERQARDKAREAVASARDKARRAVAREKALRADRRDDYRHAVGQLERERRERGRRYSRAESDSLALHNVPRALHDLFLEESKRFALSLEPDARAEAFGEWVEEHPEEIAAWRAREYGSDTDDDFAAAYDAYRGAA